MNEVENIKALSNAFGPSGFEDDVITYARKEIEKDCHVEEDSMRNLYMRTNENKECGVRILLDAHSDEVGFIVQAIKPNGTLQILPLGGWDPKNIVANKVSIKNHEGKLISGVVCSKPVHFMDAEEKGKEINFDQILVDVGATSDREVKESYHIEIGCPLAPAVDCEYDEEHEIFIGKAMDCRIGCAALLQTIKKISHKSNTVIATLSSQEEVGERGMKCAIHKIQADIAICFEGCPADDTFNEEYKIQSGLKRGPMLRHFDCSMITNPRFQRFALNLCQKYEIPVQESVRKGGGTNGGITHTYNIPTIVIGIPVRYAHSSYGITSMIDYQNACKLAVKIIEEIDIETVQSF
ncbi:MAG: M42 family peptidase [Longicatena sp.]